MPNFHRLTVPSYFGGLPSGYDYINNATSGTPAFANGVLSYGPNIGSYFVGFGDDGTSADANRPAQALAQNTDFLDNQMRSDLVQIVRTGNTTVGGSPQTSIVLSGTGNIWLGTGGYAFRDLFHIVDSNEQDIEVSGTKVIVNGISAGGSLGGGFATGSVTLTLNVGIPVGVTWRLYYCSRTNLATLPIDAMTLPFMRNSSDIAGEVVDFVNQISNPHTLGSSVLGLQAFRFQGPDGTRLAKSASLYFDCDPADSGATVRSFIWTTRQMSVDRVTALLYDDPTGTLYAGTTGVLQLDTGMAFSSLGALAFQDENLNTGGSGGMYPFWPLTSTTAANGDLYPRLFELPVTAAAFGGQTPPSLLRYVNGRYCCTVGDGTLSFGDFSGINSINAAFAYAAAAGVANLHIQVKRGSYTINASIATTGGVVLEGVSVAQTIIQTAIPAGPTAAAFNQGGFHLTLMHLTLQYLSGQHFAVLGAAGTSLFMDDVVVSDLGIQMLNSATYNNIAAVYCRQCRFAPATTGVIAVDLQFTTDFFTHNGYYFEDCSWFCADETQTVRILGASTSTQTVGRMRFQACSYTLGGTGTTSSHLTHNTGVLEINPNGGNGLLTVSDVEWLDCHPTSSTGATNAPLARVYAVALGDNSTNHLAVIGRLTIRGGRWTANQTAAGAAISPFLLSAQEIIVDDVIFVGCALDSGGPSSEDSYIIDGNTYATADWAQFIFAPGAQTVSQLTTDIRLSITSCSFRGFNQLSNSGDLWLVLGNSVNIDGVTLTDYAAGGGGSSPHSRLRVSPGGYRTGSIRNVQLLGGTTASGTWTQGSGTGADGIVILLPVTAVFTTHNPSLLLSVKVANFNSGSYDDYILLYDPTTLSAGSFWPYTLIDCMAFTVGSGLGRGIVMFGSPSFGGPSGSGDNGCTLDGFNIIRGRIQGSHFDAIRLDPDQMGVVTVDGVECVGNVAIGFMTTPKHWPVVGNYESSLTIVNSKFIDNSGGGVYLRSRNLNDEPFVIFRNNTVLSFGALGDARFEFATGNLISGSIPGSAGFFMYGLETGISTPSTGALDYVNGNPMMANMALLQTP
jgi:hypothetical protein